MVCAPYKFCIDPPLGGVLYARGYYSEGGYYMLVYTVAWMLSMPRRFLRSVIVITALENKRSGSADIAGIDNTSRAIILRFG
jgi:hypothetical protein